MQAHSTNQSCFQVVSNLFEEGKNLSDCVDALCAMLKNESEFRHAPAKLFHELKHFEKI